MPVYNKNNNSQYLTINEMVDLFYRSRFNHDPLHDFEEGEDINNSTRHRIYNKGDLTSVMRAFFEFFGWAIAAKNISRVYLAKNLMLIRESRFPRIKRANVADAMRKHGSVEPGELYITQGKYSWKLWTDGEIMDSLKELQTTDPEFIAAHEAKKIELEERKKAESNGKKK